MFAEPIWLCLYKSALYDKALEDIITFKMSFDSIDLSMNIEKDEEVQTDRNRGIVRFYLEHMETKIKELYSKLKDCYVSSESNNTDKAKRFRSLYEKFSYVLDPSVMGRAQTLSQRLNRGFKNHNVKYNTQDASRKLLDILNKIVHEDSKVSDDNLRTIYKLMLTIITDVTAVEPDEMSKILSGIIEEPWYVRNLNEEQKQAVLDGSQVICVNAGPGTGKTHLLVWKMMEYLNSDSKRHVVALSYTTAAARQLGEKFCKIVGDAKDDSLLDANAAYSNVVASTIHSYCLRLMKDYRRANKQRFEYQIVGTNDIDDIAADYCKSKGLSNITSVIDMVSGYIKNGHRYNGSLNEYMRNHHYITVDEILDVFINESKEKVFVEWIGKHIDCLLVDECQDLTSKIYDAINVICNANPQTSIFFVGDPRQNIFGFNGGSFKNFKDFVEKRNTQVSTHYLTHTYRCPQAVVNRVNGLTFLDCDNPPLQLVDQSLQGYYELHESKDVLDEATYIVDVIEKLNNHQDTCVLASWAGYLANTAVVLNEHKIPFVIKKNGLELKKEIKDMNRWLKWVMYASTKDNEAPNTENNPSLEVRLNELHQAIKQDKEAYNISSLINEIAESVYNRPEAVETLREYAARAKDFDDLDTFLYECSSRRYDDDFKMFYLDDFNVRCTTPVTEDNQPVTLSTIHSAKGLEWENVILAGADDNTLPRYNSTSPSEVDGDKKKYYVAVTRSKKNLFITFSANIRGYSRRMSPFINNTGSEGVLPWRFAASRDTDYEFMRDMEEEFGYDEGNSYDYRRDLYDAFEGDPGAMWGILD